ncbi:MAG: POTRA domain-containing protein, partial [Cyanobacteria bacterium P01_F01_bin.4]
MIFKQLRWISGSLSLISLAWVGRATAAVPIAPDDDISASQQSASATHDSRSEHVSAATGVPELLPSQQTPQPSFTPTQLSQQSGQDDRLTPSALSDEPLSDESTPVLSASADVAPAALTEATLIEMDTPQPSFTETQLSQRPGQEDRFTTPDPEAEPLPEQQPPVLPEPPEPSPEPPSPEITPETSPDEPRVAVQDIQVVGSTVFDEADFAPILAEYEGRELTIQQLRQAADEVTQLYLNEGYITSRAILSNQTIENGIVQLQVIEGSLADIQVDGADRLAGYVRDRIELGADTPLSQIDLENQLRLLRLDPLIDNIEASLR